MPGFLQRLRDAMRRWVSENDQSGDDPHVGEKSPDEPGFGRPTGAEERGGRSRPPGSSDSAPRGDD